jgi:hypothetical protein
MADETQISIFGIKELDDFFQQMRRADQRTIFLSAWRKATSSPLAQAKANLLSRVGTRNSPTKHVRKDVADSLGFVPLPAKRNSVFISAKAGARRFGRYKGYSAHWFDAGTKQRQTKRGGLNRGTMRGTSFFTDAINDNADKIMNDTTTEMINSFDKLITRHLKKQAKNPV